MKLTEANPNKAPVFKGKARSVEELIASIRDGRFTLDGRHLIIEDSLELEGLKLTSLVGCPRVIKGCFNCENNMLMALVGGPTEVGSDYHCGRNQLVTLEGAPRHIKGSFMCDYNELPSLKGGPIEVAGNYGCSYNRLTSLVGCAQTIKKNLIAGNNQYLTSLEGGPRSVDSGVFLEFCERLTSLQNVHLHLPEARTIFLSKVPITGPLLGLLRVKGLRWVELDDHKLMSILSKYLPEGNPLTCAMELIKAGYEEHARL
jgi:hypothetical protein